MPLWCSILNKLPCFPSSLPLCAHSCWPGHLPLLILLSPSLQPGTPFSTPSSSDSKSDFIKERFTYFYPLTLLCVHRIKLYLFGMADKPLLNQLGISLHCFFCTPSPLNSSVLFPQASHISQPYAFVFTFFFFFFCLLFSLFLNSDPCLFSHVVNNYLSLRTDRQDLQMCPLSVIAHVKLYELSSWRALGAAVCAGLMLDSVYRTWVCVLTWPLYQSDDHSNLFILIGLSFLTYKVG